MKQHKFPFAEVYLTEENIRKTDSTGEMIEKIQNIVGKLQESKYTLTKQQISMASAREFKLSEPFCTWDYRELKDDFSKLLSGEEVTFKANINNGLPYSAVKFSKVWIRFMLKNMGGDETFSESDFDEELQKFYIYMTMEGNAYYRCENRIYSLSLEQPIEFFFTMQNNSYVVMDIQTSSFDTLSRYNSFLSPYTTWK